MRKRDPAKIDRLVQAATEVFIQLAFDRAKVSDVSRLASVSPGTVYLYFADKDALFEMAFLRACESPLVARFDLPYRRTAGPAATAQLENAVEAIANFPQLWVAGQRRSSEGGLQEYMGILLEVANWMTRYRNAILMAHRNRAARPRLQQAFDRLVWRDLEARLAALLGSRARTRALMVEGQPQEAARLALDALAGSMLGNPIHPAPADPGRVARQAARVLSGLRDGSGHLPLQADPVQ